MTTEHIPRPSHPLAVLRLAPLNKEALKILDVPDNWSRLSNDSQGKRYIDVGGFPSKLIDGVTLATLGRQGDIVIQNPSVSRLQCLFSIDHGSQTVMLYDKSHNASTQVHGLEDEDVDPGDDKPLVFPFEYGRPRRVYVGPGVNPILGMCGVNRDTILFRIVWLKDTAAIAASRAERDAMTGLSHLARTLSDNAQTESETARHTRIHTPALGRETVIRYAPLAVLGKGAFGTVYRVVNVDTGRIIACKVLQYESVSLARREKYQREVKLMAEMEHPHIVDLIWSQNWDLTENNGLAAEIFIGLKDGSLNSLVLGGSYKDSVTLETLAENMLNHMLQALDALVCKGIIHRDVKPENILYVHRAGEFQFQLGDFGLGNHARIAISHRVGTSTYMAPEMISDNSPKTSKVDVWSLFVTVLWTLDINGFRGQTWETYKEILNFVQECAKSDVVGRIRSMAAMDPDQRASAAQVLSAIFHGEGLTTPRSQVPALATLPTLIEPRQASVPTPPIPLFSSSAAPQRPVADPEPQLESPAEPLPQMAAQAAVPRHTPTTTNQITGEATVPKTTDSPAGNGLPFPARPRRQTTGRGARVAKRKSPRRLLTRTGAQSRMAAAPE